MNNNKKFKDDEIQKISVRLYDTDAFDRLLVSEYKKKGLDIALNINSLSKQLKLSHEEIDGYLMWLYKKGSIILFSNGYGNSFYDKEKNSDKNIENIYLIRLNKTFVNKIDKNLQIIGDDIELDTLNTISSKMLSPADEIQVLRIIIKRLMNDKADLELDVQRLKREVNNSDISFIDSLNFSQ